MTDCSVYSACLPRLKLPNLPIMQPPMQIVIFGWISLYRYVTSAYSPSSAISNAVSIMSGLFFFPRSIYSSRSAGDISPLMTVTSIFSNEFQLRFRSFMRPFRLYHICRRKSNNSDIYTNFQRKLCEHYRKNAHITFVRIFSEISEHFL